MKALSPHKIFWGTTKKCAAPHPDVFWYRLNGMGAQKNVTKDRVTFFLYLFLVQTEWNIVYEYLQTKIFSRDTNILPQTHWTSNIFGHSATTTGGFSVSLNYPILNFKKTVCPKNVWMRHWCENKNLSNFLSLSGIGTRGVHIRSKIWSQSLKNLRFPASL